MDPIKYARQRIAEIAESRKPVPYHEPDPGYSPTAAFYRDLVEEAEAEAEAEQDRVDCEHYNGKLPTGDGSLSEFFAASASDIEPEFGNVRAEVLLTAEQLVNGDRNAQYGDPNQDFQRTASFWNEYLCGVAERQLGHLDDTFREGVLDVLCNLIESHDVGQMMTLLKISRSTVSPGKLDHYIDAAGYQACAAHCAGGQRK